MRLHLHVFPSDQISSTWHMALASGEGRSGCLEVGPTGFAKRVSGLLGLPFEGDLAGRRVAAVHAWMAAQADAEAWWAATFSSDPWGAAQFLLAGRDRLRELGWQGEALSGSPRLQALSGLESIPEVRRGPHDPMHAVVSALEQRAPSVGLHLELAAPRRAYAPVLVRGLDALVAQGAELVEAAALKAAAPATTGLGRLQRALLDRQGDPASSDQPEGKQQGDDSLRWLRAPTPREAAALATEQCDDTGLWLVTGASFELDAVRAGVGRPRLGAAEPSRHRPDLQLLPLAIASQYAPRDPELAVELLNLDPCPLPRRVARSLLDHLSNTPGVGGPGWMTALESGIAAHLEAYPDADAVTLERRAALLFPEQPLDELSTGRLDAVARGVADWSRMRGSTVDEHGMLAAARVATDFADMLVQLGPDARLDRNSALQLRDIAVGSGSAPTRAVELGAPAHSSDPRALPTSCPSLVWFGAVAGQAELGREIDWQRDELTAMSGAGLDLRVVSERRIIEQESWRRVLVSARERLCLVSWTYEGVSPVSEHPLFDLLEAAVGSEALLALRQDLADRLEAPAGLDTLPIFTPPEPKRLWRVDATRALERQWSSSSADGLINCPARWVLEYAAGLRPGAVDTLGQLRTVAGSFAHSLFEEVFPTEASEWKAMTSATAQAQVESRFDARVGTDCAPLTSPANLSYARLLRAQLGRAAAELVEQLRAGGWRPLAHELALDRFEREFGRQRMRGNIDLLVGRESGQHAVVDLKLGGANYRRKSLAEGSASQLAFYAEALGPHEGSHVPVAYFILEDAALLTADGAAFPAAEQIGGPSVGETATALREAWSARRDELGARLVQARAKEYAPRELQSEVDARLEREPLEHPWARKDADCQYCNQARLCARGFAGGEK